MPWLPAVELSVTIRFPANDASIALLIDALVPAASTAISVTRARPIISEVAVTAVRPGWRTVLSRANRAVIPRQLTRPARARATPTTNDEKKRPILLRT